MRGRQRHAGGRPATVARQNQTAVVKLQATELRGFAAQLNPPGNGRAPHHCGAGRINHLIGVVAHPQHTHRLPPRHPFGVEHRQRTGVPHSLRKEIFGFHLPRATGPTGGHGNGGGGQQSGNHQTHHQFNQCKSLGVSHTRTSIRGLCTVRQIGGGSIKNENCVTFLPFAKTKQQATFKILPISDFASVPHPSHVFFRQTQRTAR